jgi:hypothetical protein
VVEFRRSTRWPRAGGPALGDVNIGWIAGFLGPIAALSWGSIAPIVYTGLHYVRDRRVSRYSIAHETSETADDEQNRVISS